MDDDHRYLRHHSITYHCLQIGQLIFGLISNSGTVDAIELKRALFAGASKRDQSVLEARYIT
jgi:hypothetical protein